MEMMLCIALGANFTNIDCGWQLQVSDKMWLYCGDGLAIGCTEPEKKLIRLAKGATHSWDECGNTGLWHEMLHAILDRNYENYHGDKICISPKEAWKNYHEKSRRHSELLK